jgi:hypothetical protein
MMDPFTIAAGVMLVGGAAGMIGGYQSGKAAERQSREAARQLRWKRQSIRQQGEYDAQAVLAEGREAAGAAVAQIGASGVSSTSGSMANLIAANNINAATDANRVRADAVMRAWETDVAIINTLNQGQIDKKTAYLGGLSSGLSAAGSAAAVYGQGKKR